MRHPLAWIVGPLIVLCAGCIGNEEHSRQRMVSFRFIDEDPAVELDTSPVAETKPVFEWRWTGPSAPARWTSVNTELRVAKRNGLVVTGAADGAVLDADIELDAAAVQVIEVEAWRVGSRTLELGWGTDSGRNAAEAQTISPVASEQRGQTSVYRFRPSDDPGWRGTITGLRLVVPAAGDNRFKITGVRGLALMVDPGWIATVATRPHKVSLGNDTRNALLAVPDVKHSRTVRIPDDAVLEISYGTPGGTDQPTTFTVEIEVSGRRPKTLLDRILDDSESGRWHHATLDLASYGGQEATITLSTASELRLAANRAYPAWANPEIVAPAVDEGPPNVVLICLDTLRADGLSLYGNPLPTSPNIDAWARERGVVFANAVAPAPWTLPSHASLFTGHDALRHGVNYASPAPPELDMLAEQMRRHGYTTGAVTGGGYLGNRYGFTQGFDTFAFWRDKDSAGELKWVAETSLDWLDDKGDRPFFLFVHTYEVHYPHRRRQPFFNRFAELAGVDPPAGAVQMRSRGWQDLIAQGDYFVIRRPGSHDWDHSLTEDEAGMVRLMYHSAVAYTDSKIRTILDRLHDLGIGDRTVVVVTSDHGEALGEDGRAGHYYLDDFNVMVPLIIELPGGAHRGTTVEQQVRLVDVAPTILDAVGLPVPPALDGRSLIPLLAGNEATHPDHAWTYAGSSNRGLGLRVDNSVKYVFPDPAWSELTHREALYDLTTDPTETTNLIADHSRSSELRNTTRDTILEQHSGYRLEIVNGGPSVLSGRLTGQWARHDRVKVADHDCRCVHWRRGQRAHFELEPGGRVELLFSDLGGPGVGLVGPSPGTGALDIDFDLDAIELPAAIERVAGEWVLVEAADGPPATGFFLTLVGDRTPKTEEAPPPDSETLEQLRALGYVE